MKRWVIALLILVLGGGGGALLFSWHYNYYLDSPVSPEPMRKKVVIPKGADLAMVIEILSQEGVVAIPLYFKLHAISSGQGKRMRPGVYYFELDHTPKQILTELTEGPKVPYIKVRIPEGAHMWEVARVVGEAGLASEEEFFELMADCEWLKSIGVKVPDDRVLFCAEGYLFPETYFIEPGHTVKDLVRTMVKQTRSELRKAKKENLPVYAKILQEFKLTDHAILTLASLIEKETGLRHEKRLVSSVLYNRMRKDMPLQCDPTLTYTPQRKGARPTKKDRLNAKNRYNTYEFMGLPPGPIGNPGRDAIAAAVAPSSSQFLYFVAKRDETGGHHFSRTYVEHVKAVKKYLKSQ